MDTPAPPDLTNWQEKYGLFWPPDATDLDIELLGLDEDWDGDQISQAEHFWNFAEAVWNRPDLPVPLFVRHPWAELMIERAFEHKVLAIAGCSSSTKSWTMAGYAIARYMSDPRRTTVLVTSTDLKAARKRIWGAIMKLWNGMPRGMPGKVRDSIGSINFVDQDGRVWDTCGISLIAAEKKKEREAVGKMIGIKNQRVILIADELPELSAAITNAFFSNLVSNPFAQIIAMGNPASRFDAFGELCEPENGWSSVSEADFEWKTKRGVCIRFDACEWPNVTEQEEVYPFGPTYEMVEDAKRHHGERSLAFYRFFKGFWAPDGLFDGIYTEADIVSTGSEGTTKWREKPVTLAGFDPAFTNGGDRALLYFGSLGYSEDGIFTLQFDDYVHLAEDITKKSIPRTQQIVGQLIAECRAREIDPYNVGIDSTGAGAPLCDVVASMWSDEIHRVNFNGSPTDRRVSERDAREGKDAYANRVSEIWMAGKEFLRTGQLRGISREMAREMTARTFSTVKGMVGLKAKVEPKPDFKARNGFSPDIADAAFVMLDLARERHGFYAVEVDYVTPEKSNAKEAEAKWIESLDATDEWSELEVENFVPW